MEPGCKLLILWWPGTELNRRRQPFQGCALPAELPGHEARVASEGLLRQKNYNNGEGPAPNLGRKTCRSIDSRICRIHRKHVGVGAAVGHGARHL